MMDSNTSLPAMIGEYEVLGELARDDASVVLRARQVSLDRVVALKVVREEWAADPADLERFLRGARAAARLDHPHIVRIFDVGRTDDLHYFAMGLVEGQSLSQRVAARGPLSPREASELVRRVAQATAYTHEQKIVHRGLSPDSVLLETDGKPRVTGFGLARPTAPGHSLTMGGVRVDPFTAPETVTGTGLADSPAVDVYGLGGILYFALTGQPPHTAASVAELAANIGDAPVVSPRKLNSKVPRELEAICLRCLATSPSERFASAALVVDALDQFLSGKGNSWLGSRTASAKTSPEGSTERISAGANTAAATNSDTSLLSGVASSRRARIRDVSLLIGILLLVGGVVSWQLRDNAGRDTVGTSQVTDQVTDTTKAALSEPTAPNRDQPSLLEMAEQRLLQDVREAERKITGGLTEAGWTFGYAAAADRFAQAFRDYGMDLGKHSTIELVTFYEARPEERHKTIRYWLTRWELCALAAKRPEVEPLRTLLAVVEDDAWGQQFLGARSDPNPARLLALATATTKMISISDPIPSELVAEALFARGLDAKPETLALVTAATGIFYTTHAWPSYRFAQLQLPIAERATGTERVRLIDDVSGYLRTAQQATGGNDQGLKLRITGIEKLVPSPNVDREVAEWVLAQRGSVTVNGYSWPFYENYVSRLAELPAHPFRVVGVSLSGASIDDSSLARLGSLSSCKQLYLANCPITDEGLATLSTALPLTDLDLAGTKVTDALLGHLTHISRLRLQGTLVTETGIDRLRNANPRLKLLNMPPAQADIPHADGGFALHFEQPGWVDIPVTVDGKQTLTVEAVVLLPFELRSNVMKLFCGHNNQQLGLYRLYVRSDTLSLSLQKTNGGSGGFFGTSIVDASIPLNQACHVASVVDGFECRTYLNGRLVSTISEPLRVTAGQFRLCIGSQHNFTTAELFRGILDEVRISSVARYTGDFIPAVRHVADEHTLALYHFDEPDGDVVQDSSGHNHHGTLIGETKRVKAMPYTPPTSAKSSQVTK